MSIIERAVDKADSTGRYRVAVWCRVDGAIGAFSRRNFILTSAFDWGSDPWWLMLSDIIGHIRREGYETHHIDSIVRIKP